MNETMEWMLKQMVDDFNCYSKTAILSCAEGEKSRDFLQWTLGEMNCVEEYMVELAKVMGVKLDYKYGVCVFGRGEKWEKELKYRTVEIVKEGKQVEAD